MQLRSPSSQRAAQLPVPAVGRLRKIIHCDADCFYAAVEMRDNPSLRDRPIAIGGDINRGVIATCNYPARTFGVHSAMPTALALKKCPQLLLLPGNMAKYRAASQQIQAIFRRYTDLLEPLSLDEAYLDVTDSSDCQGSATWLAQRIRQQVEQEVGITLSAGVAPNKFLAKIASDWQKPNGLFVIRPEQVPAFVRDLPVEKLHGVGRVTADKLRALGIRYCADLQQVDAELLAQHFGVFGQRLAELSHGWDERQVEPHQPRKSLSVEHTFAQDLHTVEQCLAAVERVHQQFMRRWQPLAERRKVRSLFVKVRFADFKRSAAERAGASQALDLYRLLLAGLLSQEFRPVRLLGVGVRLQPLSQPHQFDLDF